MNRVTGKTALKVIYWNVLVVVVVVAMGGASVLRRLHQYDALIVKYSRAADVDPRLVASLIWQESRFKANRVGRAGEIGLMQVTHAVALDWAAAEGVEDFRKQDLFDPATNLRAGIWYLARALAYWKERDDPLPYALAEYNAGRTQALRWARGTHDERAFIKAISYPGTRRYVEHILRRYRGHI